jgi:Domain of unknown function (DUF5666)
MIRQICAWVIMVAFVAGLAAPAFAQATGTQPAPAAPAPAAKPAAPAKTDATKGDAKMAKPKSATGTVKTASADSIVVVDKDKKEWTFAVSKDTKITKGGKAVEARYLAANDSVTIQFTEANGKMMAKTVLVRAAKAAAKTQ